MKKHFPKNLPFQPPPLKPTHPPHRVTGHPPRRPPAAHQATIPRRGDAIHQLVALRAQGDWVAGVVRRG